MSVAHLHPVIPEGEDHHFEPARGLPERLPVTESLIWQGTPEWRALAVRAFHVRKVSLYFAVLAAWAILSGWYDGLRGMDIFSAAVPVSVVGLLSVAILVGLARLTARHSVYTVTDKRIVMAIGIALQIRLNLPFSRIDGVSLKSINENDKTGDVALTLSAKDKLSYAVLWPHARPWRLSRVEPTLRCIPDAEAVASRIAKGLVEHERVDDETVGPL